MEAGATVEKAWRELGGDLRRWVRRRVPHDETAEDLLQEIFLRMHEHVHEVRDTDRLAAWIFRIARSVVVDHLRRARPTTDLDAAPETVLPDDANLNEEVASWLRPMLAQLPDEYREAVELTELEGLTQRELADRLGLSLTGAKSRVQRGRKMLEAVVTACCRLELDARGNVIDYEKCGDGCPPGRR